MSTEVDSGAARRVRGTEGMRMLWSLVLGCGGGSIHIDDDPTDGPTDPPEDTGLPTPPPLPDCVEGAYIADSLDIDFEPCATSETLHAFAGAGGSTVALTFDGLDHDVMVDIETVYGDPITSAALVDGGSIAVELPWTGEFIARIQTEPHGFTVTRSCSLECDRPYTRYPLFLMHGMAGTDSFLSVLDYWFEIADVLRDDGYEVATDAVDPFQSSEVRALQWADHIEDYLNDGRHRRLNLIGHSQGGLDARYVATLLDPDHQVASVLTIGTPHRGVAMIDAVEDLLALGLTQSAIDAAFDALGGLYGIDSDQDIVAQLQGFDPDVAAQYNLDVPDRPDVHYGSWAGRSCQLLDLLCQAGANGEIVTPALSATHLVLEILEGDNDGLVTVDSARWGHDYGVLTGDHLDQVGLLAGPITGRGFDPIPFYRAEAERLRQLGF